MLFSNSEFIGDFYKPTSDKRLRKLCDYLSTKIDNIHYINMLDYIKNYPHLTWDKISNTTEYKQLLKNIK